MAEKGRQDQTRLVLVAAMGRNRVIGHGGRMPWHLPADLAHFKRLTMGHVMIMGRKTFEAIGRPLPGRTTVVLSRSAPELPEGVQQAHGWDEALAGLAGQTVMVVGGGEIYAQALPRAHAMELTLIDAEFEGDAFFPRWTRKHWQLTSHTVRPADDANPCAMSFCSLIRVDG